MVAIKILNLDMPFRFPGKLTDLVKHLFLLFLIFQIVRCDSPGEDVGGAMADEAAQRDTACDKLKAVWIRDSFLTRKDRGEYCINGCTFTGYVCSENAKVASTVSAVVNLTEIWHAVETFANDALADKFDTLYDGPVFEPPAATVEAWVDLVAHILPLLGCMVPILLNQYKYHNFWGATLMTFAQFCLSFAGIMPVSMAIHNALFCFLSLANSSNSGYLFDSVQTLGWIQFVFFAMFYNNPYWQVFILLVAVIGYFMYLNHIFFIRRPGANAGIAVVASQLFVLVEELYYVRENMQEVSLVGAAIEMVLYAAAPIGKSKTAAGNIFRLSVYIANKFNGYNLKIAVFLVLPFLQLFMLLLFRGALGAFYLYSMRYKRDASTLLSGLYIYMIDLFGPFRCLFRQGFKIEHYNERRIFYGFIGCLMAILEYKYAHDVFWIRLFFSSLDEVFYRSKYGKVMHYLQYELDFMQVAFPHSRAPSWMSLDKLAEVAKTTSTLISVSAGRTSRGVGVVLTSGGRAMLYTVRHVINQSNLIQFQDQSVSSPDFRDVTSAADPLVAMKIEYDSAPFVELVTFEELEYIDFLAFISVSEVDGKNYTCIVPEFKVLKDGTLRAIVNLKKGDSGAPCFAILKDGSLRFCGVVSQGNPRDGGGNIISMCIHHGVLKADSSDDESEKALSVQQFNAVRRVKFASDSTDRYDNTYAGMINYIRNNQELIETFKKWKTPISYDDILKKAPYDAIIERYHIDNYVPQEPEQTAAAVEPVREERDQDEGAVGGADDAGGVGHAESKKYRKQDQKRRNKDKAYRKRAFDTMLALNAFLQGLYSQRDSKNIFEAIAMGNLPPLTDREYVITADGRDWMVSDVPMDPNHS